MKTCQTPNRKLPKLRTENCQNAEKPILSVMRVAMDRYRERVVDEILKEKLEQKGAIVIEGPKWCGKTTTALQVSKSVLRMDKPCERAANIRLSEIAPERILEGETPRLIDEWQVAPKIWDAIRYEVDQRGEEGQFILTGSAVPLESEEITHSETGRFTWLTMRTMSLFESEESSGKVSLLNLFSQPEKVFGKNKLDIDSLSYAICRGGWPQAIRMTETLFFPF